MSVLAMTLFASRDPYGIICSSAASIKNRFITRFAAEARKLTEKCELPCDDFTGASR